MCHFNLKGKKSKFYKFNSRIGNSPSFLYVPDLYSRRKRKISCSRFPNLPHYSLEKFERMIDWRHSFLIVLTFISLLKQSPITSLKMARRPINHLFIGTKTDIASMNIAKHVLQRHQWNVIPTSHITFSNPTPLTAPFPPSIPSLAIASTPTYQISNNHLFFYTPVKQSTSTRRLDRFFFWIIDHSQLSLNYPNVLFSQLLSNYFFPTSLSPESKSSNSFSGDLKDSNFVDIETERERHRISCNIQSPDDLNID